MKIDGTAISNRGPKVNAGTFVMQVDECHFTRMVLE